MKGKMYRLTGTGLFGKHSKGRLGTNAIPQPRHGGKIPSPARARDEAPHTPGNSPKPSKP